MQEFLMHPEELCKCKAWIISRYESQRVIRLISARRHSEGFQQGGPGKVCWMVLKDE